RAGRQEGRLLIVHEVRQRAAEQALAGQTEQGTGRRIGVDEAVVRVGDDESILGGIEQACELELALLQPRLETSPVRDVPRDAMRVYELCVLIERRGVEQHVARRPVAAANPRFAIRQPRSLPQALQDFTQT